MAFGIGLLLIWLFVAVMSVFVYLAMLSDDEDNIQFDKIERRIIVGCLIWPIPLLIYVVFGILDIFEWAQDNVYKRLGR
jgi:heme/copper-type cytochrome/quinol oxidase subunit 2